MPNWKTLPFIALACLTSLTSTSLAETQFLALSDVHYGVRALSGKWGHGHETSLTLWQNAQTKAKDLITREQPAFTIYLGDMPAHGELEPTRKQEFTTVLGGLANIAGASQRLYFLPGNNDTNAGDYCQFTDQSDQTPFASASSGTWPALNAQDTLIDQSAVSIGYYSAYPLGPTDTSLRLITLNTVMFNARYGRGFHWNPCQPYMTDTDIQKAAEAQITWLDNQLSDAKANSERVLIAMHVPPGLDGFGGSPMWDPDLKIIGPAGQTLSVENRFTTLMAEFFAQITGVLTAHTHLDDMRRMWTCSGDVAGLAIGIPGITTDHGNNPAMKLFTMNAAHDMTEATTFYASEVTGHNWADANRYDFTETYCPTKGACGGKSLSQIIASWPSSQNAALAARMEAVLKTKRGTVSGRYYAKAMDARPQCDTGQ
ncbi:metallophosphoesterase [uncultured Pelagimonas sp.]|uniref:metallophosphoesterase n=1 Tax=uncultured Pelagimonas sp. TaxID=1618102 RepID=UPI002633FAAE|nr:metallophosphoesterase [uncultured Pelagimonas sp.]